MNNKELKIIARSKARLAKGFVNLLKDDVDQIWNDINVFDMVSLEETISDTKRTAQQLMNIATELEYYHYLLKEDA
jgi:hypothetical protein